MGEVHHRKLERTAIGFMLAIILAASVGGIVEIAPLFTIHETVEDAPDMRVYTPLEWRDVTFTSEKAATPATAR